MIIENRIPLTDEVTVDLVLKCLQHLHLLALHLEILGYIPHLLNGLVYLRRIGDFKGDKNSVIFAPRMRETFAVQKLLTVFQQKNITGGS